MNRVSIVASMVLISTNVVGAQWDESALSQHADCPTPTTNRGGICVLEADVTLTNTLILPSYTHLNCQGHKVLPQMVGTPDNRDTSANEYRSSIPHVAILVRSAVGAKVQNCVIGDPAHPFDFGIYILDSKRPDGTKAKGNKVLHNDITTRSVGVTIMRSDDNVISGNHVSFGIDTSSVGIAVIRNSDNNIVEDNLVEAPSLNQRNKVPSFPQDPVPAATTTPRAIQCGVTASAVFNFVADDGVLTQVPLTPSMLNPAGVSPLLGGCIGVKRCNLNQTKVCASDSDCGAQGPCVTVNRCEGDQGISCTDNLDCGLTVSDMTSEWLSEGLVIDGNTVDVPTTYENTAATGIEVPLVITTASCPGAIIRNNLVKAGEDGIHFSAQDNFTFAGICSENSSRYCGTNAHCQLLGNFGSCVGARTIRNANFGATDTLAENNTVVGPLKHGITVSRASKNVTLVGNNISGASDAGILLRDSAIESTTIMRNTVSGSRYNVAIVQRPGGPVIEKPRFYGSLVTLNDFLVDPVDGSPQKQITTRLCNHFISRLSCVAEADCDNSCADVDGDASTPTRCKRTGNVCAGDDACVGPNLVGGVRVAVGSCVDAYSLATTELSSADGRGNYWGLTCEEGGFHAADSTSLLVSDSHPYGEPVSTTPDPELPVTCR